MSAKEQREEWAWLVEAVNSSDPLSTTQNEMLLLNAIPVLLAEVEQLERERDDAREELNTWRSVFPDIAPDYQPITAMSFGHAIVALKAGKRVARASWNPKGMWLQHVTDSWARIEKSADAQITADIERLPWIGMKTADNKFVPWLPSQIDILADDWQEVQSRKNQP